MPPSSGAQDSVKRKSTFDLKNQLSDLQNKLSESQQGKPTTNRNSSNAGGDLVSDENSVVPKLPNVFGKRNKEGNKRQSLPAMSLSAPGSQQGKAGNDVNFVVGLSENLLLECRRLQAENTQYKQKLQDTEQDLQRVTKQLTNVSAVTKKFMGEEEALKDRNWELEGSLKQLKEKYEKLSADYLKSAQLKNESETSADALKEEVEHQKAINVKLADELTSVKQAWTNESKSLKHANEELNDENDQLHKSVTGLKEEMEKLKGATQKGGTTIPILSDSGFFNRNDSDSDDEFSVVEDPSSSPVRDAPTRNIELEKETIQSNLAHSKQTIVKLRSTIVKLKAEKDELQRKVMINSQNISATFSSPVNKHKKAKTSKSPLSLSNKKTLSFHETDTTKNESWEDFSLDNGPENAAIWQDSSSDDDEKFSAKPSGTERKLLSQELENDPSDIINKYIADHNLVLVDANEYNKLKDLDSQTISSREQDRAIVTAAEQYNILALPSSSGSHKLHIPTDVLRQKCEEENLVVLNKEDYEELMETVKYEPTEAELIERISRYNKVVLPIDEHYKLIESVEHPSLDTLKRKLAEDHHQVALSEIEYEKLKSPTIDRIKVLASDRGHILIPTEDHENLLQKARAPAVDALSSRVQQHETHSFMPQEQNSERVISLNEPDLSNLRKQSSSNNHTLISDEEHEALTDNASQTLAQRAQSENAVVVPSAEYGSLLEENATFKAAVSNPSIEYLTSKALNHGYVLVEKTEYETLSQSNLESIEAKAAREGKLLIADEELRELKHSLEEPELAYLSEKASKMSYHVMPVADYDKLIHSASNPTEDVLNDYANSKGSVIMDRSAHDSLLGRATAPSMEEIQEHASKHSHMVIPEDEHTLLMESANESVSSRAEKEGLIAVDKAEFQRLKDLENSPPLDYLKQKALESDHQIIHTTILNELNDLNEEPLASKAMKDGKILLTKDEYAELQNNLETLKSTLSEYKQKYNKPDKSWLVAAATGLGLAVLESEDYTTLSAAATSPSIEQLQGHALTKDHLIVSKVKYEALEKKASNPSEDDLTTFAQTIGKRIVDADELERLKLEALHPSRDVLTRAAGDLGMVLVASKEYDLLKTKYEKRPSPIDTSATEPALAPSSPSAPSTPTLSSVGKSKVLSSKEHYEDMIRNENEKNQEKQRVMAAKALGIVSLSTDEYKRLLAKQHVAEPTISDIYNGAKSFGLTVLPQSDYKALLKRQNVSETKEDLEVAARNLGFSIVPLTLSTSQSVVSFTDDEEFHDAVSHQSSKVSLVSSDLYEDALSRQVTNAASMVSGERTKPLSMEELHERAADVGFKLVPLGDAYETEDDVTSIEDNEAEDLNENTVQPTSLEEEKTVPLFEFEALQKQLEESLTKVQQAENKGVSEYELIKLAPQFGLVAISKEEYDHLTRSLSDEDLREMVGARNSVILTAAEFENLQRESKNSKQKPTFSSLSALAGTLGFSLISSADLEDLKQASAEKAIVPEEKSVISDSHLLQLLTERGYIALTEDDHRSLTAKAESDPSAEQVSAYLANQNLITLSKTEYDGLQSQVQKLSSVPSEDELRDLATQLNLKVLNAAEFSDLENRKVTELEIKELAPALGLAVISQSELLHLQQGSLTQEELASKASDLGFSLVTAAEVADLRKGRDISPNDLALKAADMNLVLISQQTYEDLKSSSFSDEGIEAAARKLGLLCIPESAYVPTTVAPIPEIQNVVVLPRTYYNKLARSHGLSIERISMEELIEHCKRRGIAISTEKENNATPEKYDGLASPARSQHSPQSSYHSPVDETFRASTKNTPNANMISSPSAFSIATNVSLTDHRMIPALTQTIIGEYLYKYYRRLGPFSSISENRHERYFWIHPYSLTLYWSATNPVLGDPSTNKIRGAAILRVEDVEDNNPLPPGLYHKSIIVHSSERSFKITCPTRQRHNVWYNSLRYLIERTTDGLHITENPEHNSNRNITPTIEEEDGADRDDIDTYRYLKPRASMMKHQRTISNPTRKSSRIFSSAAASSIQRSSTSASLHRKTQ